MLADNDWGIAAYEDGQWFVARDEGRIISAIHVTDLSGDRYYDDVVTTDERRGSGIGLDEGPIREGSDCIRT